MSEYHAVVSRRKALVFCGILLFVGLLVLGLTEYWWPGILIAVGIPFALRQYLLGRSRDMCISLFVFLGGWISIEFPIPWNILLPTLFCLGALYVLFHEFFAQEAMTEEEKEEDQNLEIKEDK